MNCAKCDVDTKGSYFEVEGEKICNDCFEEGKVLCLHCKNKIDDEYLMAFECMYHKECFRCSECDIQITAKFYRTNGAVICVDCNEREDYECIKCKVKGGKEMVRIGKYGIPFHKVCFTCDECGEVIDPKSKFKVKGNKLLTQSCYEKLVNSAN